MKICVYGTGAREAAIRNAVLESPLCTGVVNIDDNPDLIIIGPEQPICDGLVDEYAQKGVRCIGVNKYFSQLESSKLFAKIFAVNNGIKCAKLLPIEYSQYPQVVKFDGLCKGKGVKVVDNDDEKNKFTRKFDGQRYFIEEYLVGDELSLMSFFNGKKLINFCPARDFKRLSADKTSPNTGGMGAYCPVSLTSDQEIKLKIYSEKLEKALINAGADFEGFIYSGLIWTKDDWYLLEYNVRLGDPECQTILAHLKNDFLSILLLGVEPQYKDGYSGCLTIAAKGYPEEPVKGDLITLPEDDTISVLFAGVKEIDGKLYSDGGRVLSLVTTSANPFPELKAFADKIVMQNKYYRTDIDIK